MNAIKKSILLILFSLGFLAPYHSKAQDSDLGNWLMYIGNKKLNQKWNLHNEVQYRNYNAIGDLEQLLLRTGLGYSFNENTINILLGYGYILSENYIGIHDDKISINEHRIYEQFTSKQKIGKVKITHRYRFEQRFVESDFKLRFRYFLSVNIPITHKEKNNFYVSGYNEIFINSESSVFDRNRLYTGLGYEISSNVRCELGYMNQYFESSKRDQINLICFVNF